jgi:hypothetical protein
VHAVVLFGLRPDGVRIRACAADCHRPQFLGTRLSSEALSGSFVSRRAAGKWLESQRDGWVR